MTNKNSSHFFCYNRRLSFFLSNEGINFITVAKDLKTNKIFSLYEIDEDGKLQEALDKYKNKK